MKYQKLITITALFFSIFSNGYAQNFSLGLALKGSTMGYGGDAIFKFHNKMDVRLGLDYMKISYPTSFSESEVSYDANILFKTGSITALYDYYLTESIFVAAGIGVNNFNINAKGSANSDLMWGDIKIPSEKIGSFEFDINPGLPFSPYLGLGFGKTIGIKNNFAAAFEIGSYIQGSPQISIKTDGLISPTSNPDHGQEELFESQLSQYYLYPILKLSLSYKILSF